VEPKRWASASKVRSAAIRSSVGAGCAGRTTGGGTRRSSGRARRRGSRDGGSPARPRRPATRRPVRAESGSGARAGPGRPPTSPRPASTVPSGASARRSRPSAAARPAPSPPVRAAQAARRGGESSARHRELLRRGPPSGGSGPGAPRRSACARAPARAGTVARRGRTRRRCACAPSRLPTSTRPTAGCSSWPASPAAG
jgi:hypothetical protein